MKIVARLADPHYGKKYRNGVYILRSMWEWGVGDDCKLYCRDYGENSIMQQWTEVKKLKLKMDLEVMERLNNWSHHVKGLHSNLNI